MLLSTSAEALDSYMTAIKALCPYSKLRRLQLPDSIEKYIVKITRGSLKRNTRLALNSPCEKNIKNVTWKFFFYRISVEWNYSPLCFEIHMCSYKSRQIFIGFLFIQPLTLLGFRLNMLVATFKANWYLKKMVSSRYLDVNCFDRISVLSSRCDHQICKLFVTTFRKQLRRFYGILRFVIFICWKSSLSCFLI